MRGFPPVRLLVGRWFCSGGGVAADALGECILVYVAVPFLLGYVSDRISIQPPCFYSCCPILGVRRGLEIAQIKPSFAIMPALATTILMVPC
jgi:hypothetical protein